MSDYSVNVKRLLKEGKEGDQTTEIWAEITDKKTSKTINRRIWWKDNEGISHDETPFLPVEFRGMVDKAWLEKGKRW